ncbi:MAG: A/G-specific adenine glycosylase [Myxococcota bacterium]
MAGRKAQPVEPVDDERSRALARALEPWFVANQREMSWRRTRDPYSIWVSEIMLQQTRVETVERFYDAFLRRFPTLQALASADQEAVLQQWSGLGYYRRARLLHKGAQFVARELGGTIPQAAAQLRSIPGIGDYTAGAIASIAFDRPEPLVDGNVARVLSRIEGIEEPKQQQATARRHWGRVAGILQHGTPRLLAQSLMELGATVCTPKSPSCAQCPVTKHCDALRDGSTDRIPAPRKKVAQPVDAWLALAVTWRGRLLLVRRPGEGLLADLWCLPLVSAPALPVFDSNAASALLSAAPRWADAPLAEVRHVFTHRIWKLHPLIGKAARKPKLNEVPAERQCWITPGQRPDGGLPRVTAKLLERVGFAAPAS